MKKLTFDFIKNKPSTKKEINISFTQCQDKTKNKKNFEDTNINQSLAQVEISFWKKNISQLEEQCESLKSFQLFKDKQLTLLNSNPSLKIKKTQYENEQKLNLMKAKFDESEHKLKEELSNLKSIKNIIEKTQDEKRKNKKAGISFSKIDTVEINNQYKGVMTTTHGEMCRSRLGNKLLLSLNVDEINKHQVFDRMNLAYPVLKRKKIQFSYFGEEFNTKKLGKKKINLNDFNNFKVSGIPDGVQTVV